MSGVVRGIGKVFKKVVKVAKVVLPVALAAAAVVFTGGAALGLTPTFMGAIGGVVTSLGIGGAAAGALTGAVVGAGFGSAGGAVTSLVSGGNVIKGMQKGALTGAVTGGVLGGVSPSTFGIVRGADGAWTTANAIRTGSTFGAAGSGNEIAKNATTGFYERVGSTASQGIAPAGGTAASQSSAAYNSTYTTPVQSTAVPPPTTGAGAGTGLNAGGALPPGFGPSGGTVGSMVPAPGGGSMIGQIPASGVGGAAASGPMAAAPVAAAAAPAGGGIGGFISQNPLLAGNLLTSVGGFLSGGEESASDTVRARAEEERRMAEFAYGGVYTRPNPMGLPPGGYQPPPSRWFLNPVTNTVEERPI